MCPWKQWCSIKREDLFHLPLVVDVFGKDIFVERIAGRAVYEQKAILAPVARQLAQKIPAARILGRSAERLFQLLARPEDGPLGARVESFGIEQGSLVVVAQHANVALHHQVDAFAGIGPIADDVAQAVDFGDPLLPDIGQHRLESFEVAVNVADQGTLHESRPFVAQASH